MIEKSRITAIVEEHLKDPDLFLVEVKVSGRNKIMVFLDGDKGVPISSCAEVSRHIESQLDRDVEDFELEVSSVGVDTPLTMPRQFVKNVGREIVYTDAEGKKVKAKLIEAGNNGITIEKEISKKKKKKEEAEDPVQKLTYNEVKDVKVQVSFKSSDK
ncbi:MAG: ribosome assembly cofactor RimP [Bacteroidales bacterium]|nr:ribosome assembly cofactor RimP [Bacteroidales bacterium]